MDFASFDLSSSINAAFNVAMAFLSVDKLFLRRALAGTFCLAALRVSFRFLTLICEGISRRDRIIGSWSPMEGVSAAAVELYLLKDLPPQ